MGVGHTRREGGRGVVETGCRCNYCSVHTAKTLDRQCKWYPGEACESAMLSIGAVLWWCLDIEVSDVESEPEQFVDAGRPSCDQQGQKSQCTTGCNANDFLPQGVNHCNRNLYTVTADCPSRKLLECSQIS